jgi:hypothetical protein
MVHLYTLYLFPSVLSVLSKKIIVISIADPWLDDPVASTTDEDEEPDPEEAHDVRFCFLIFFLPPHPTPLACKHG